jgi:hypothetical protein
MTQIGPLIQKGIYKSIYIDVFALAHFLYESFLKNQKINLKDPHLHTIALGSSSGGKEKIIYAQLAINMIEFLDIFEKPDLNVYLLFDNPTSKVEARSHLSPSYKENRKSKMPPTFFRTVDFIQFFCLNTYGNNFKIVRIPLREADDLIKVLIKEEKEDSLCITNDSDWYAVLRKDPRVDLWWFFRSEKDFLYTYEDFEKEFQFEPSESSVVLYKALLGDHADSVPPVLSKKDIKKEELLYLIENYKDSKDSLPASISFDNNISLQVKNILKEKRDQYRLNLKLVDKINTSLDQINRYTFSGKDNKLLRETLLKVLKISLDNFWPPQEFKFGGVKKHH